MALRLLIALSALVALWATGAQAHAIPFCEGYANAQRILPHAEHAPMPRICSHGPEHVPAMLGNYHLGFSCALRMASYWPHPMYVRMRRDFSFACRRFSPLPHSRAHRYACAAGDCAAHLEEAATNFARTAVKPIKKDNTLVAPPGADLDIFAMCEYVPRSLFTSYATGLTALPPAASLARISPISVASGRCGDFPPLSLALL